jgi:hypothetical protein
LFQIEEGIISDELLNRIISKMSLSLPLKCRGIRMTEELIKVTMECLNEEPSKTLPQNCRQVENRFSRWIGFKN